ncbi:uncharacterized protein LOC125178784 [Hyalella azteca]|uniref:Uncharacterized protein LOC125178784 n=1 Tax=Hyalella azteca TaxID=294128 RepID=A0A979FQD9_HYAAZ|nr:uncharacterized protein LOC125178784 [Hyalella azteca]
MSKVLLPTSQGAIYRPPTPTNASREVARGRPVTASPNWADHVKENAVDGRNDTKYHSDTTGANPKPWLLVNLVGSMWVKKIRVLPYVGGKPYRVTDYQFLLGNDEPPTAMNFSQYDLVGAIDGPVPRVEKWHEFDVSPPRCSRYVAVYKHIARPFDTYVMEVAELEVIDLY